MRIIVCFSYSVSRGESLKVVNVVSIVAGGLFLSEKEEVVEWCKGCSGVVEIESAREDSVVMGVVSIVEIVSMVRSCSCPLFVTELWQYSECSCPLFATELWQYSELVRSGGRRSWPLSLY